MISYVYIFSTIADIIHSFTDKTYSMKIAKYIMITKALLSTLIATSNTLHAASGQTSVTVTFPEIVVLHYRSELTINFTGDSNLGIDESSASISVPLAPVNGDGTINASGTTSTSIAVEVQNMWAVRGITNNGEIEVSAQIDTGTATATGGSEVVMSSLLAKSGLTSGGTIDVTSTGLAPANAVYGGITFSLDISNVTETGDHTGMEYTITATAP